MSKTTVQSLLAPQILAMWDAMQVQRTVLEKALTIIAHAYTDVAPKDLLKLTLGQRNNRLIKIRERIFGNQMPCVTHCVHCHELIEFTLRAQELYQAGEAIKVSDTVTISGYTFHFRLLSCEDLMLSLNEGDAESMYQCLMKCSIFKINNDEGALLDNTQVLPSIWQQFSEHLQQCDPQAEIMLTIACQLCGKQSQMPFDIAGYLIQEVTTYAKQLLHEVHLLAATYGWTEKIILAMSRARRKYYLDIVMA